MKNRWINLSPIWSPLWVAVLGLGAGINAGCKTTDCGEGTIERDGVCEPANEVVDPAACGEFTELQGDQCVPIFPPTECDPATTATEVDPETGMVTCIGTGGGGCSAPLACPAPSAGKQTVCGRLYNFEDNEPLAAMGATGTRCNPAMPSADGPCAVILVAYDALEFAGNPTTAEPRPTVDTYVDDCGRWRLTDIDTPTGPFIGFGIDDIVPGNRGPGGTTNTVGIATASVTSGSINNLEAYIVKPSTTASWQATGGPSIATGYYAPVYRANRTGFAGQDGVVVVRQAGPVPANDFYFSASQVTRTTVDPARNFTGANGTALVTMASLADVGYSGVPAGAGMGLPPECRYVGAPGVTLPGIVFISIFRPTDQTGMTCPR